MTVLISFPFDLCPELVLGVALLLGSVSTIRGRAIRGRMGTLLHALTLDEKLTLLHGAEDPTGRAESAYVPGIPRLDIPALRVTDGPLGARTDGPATVLPAPIMMGATFAPELVQRCGRVLGRDAQSRDQNVLRTPKANLVRVPQAGQNHESFSEDPLLVSRLLAEAVRGIEDGGMISAVPHYVADHFENTRPRVSAEVDERTLRELYLPPFRAAVDAGAGSVVAGQNRVNGTYVADHEHLLSEVLKREIGFDGWVMTDWFARHSLGALEAGLDQEMPGLSLAGAPQAVYFDEPLRVAVERGYIPEAAVDEAVRRLLLQLHRRGLLEDKPARSGGNGLDGTVVAREAAVSGAVLLQNNSDVLPIDEEELTSLAVIGPPAVRSFAGGAETTRAWTGSLEALKDRLGTDVSIRYEAGIDLDGVPIPASALAPSNGLNVDGLRRKTPDGTIQIDPFIDFTGADALPSGSAWTWTGTLTAPTTGTYRLVMQTRGGSGRLSVDGETRASTEVGARCTRRLSTDSGLDRADVVLPLEAGETHTVSVAADGAGLCASDDEALQVRLSWVPPAQQSAALDRATDAAAAADGVVVFGFTEETKMVDRPSLSLPDPQDALIQSVAAVSEQTTVVLNTGGPVRMPWVDDVEAVIQMWYPGEEGGDATAAILTGDATPGGRLPVTFPRVEADTPTFSEERYPGINGKAHYSEGVFVGYRWYDEKDIDPLFAFGHGLSYTSFSYSALSIWTRKEGYDAQFRVRNTGEREGTAVPQVYVGRPADPLVPMPPKELAGFDRVELAPGEAASVFIQIDRRQLSYWSAEDEAWRVAPGRRPIYVGASARDIHLEGALFVE